MKALPRFDVEGQVALVTGAARGLGRAIALALAEAGADIGIGLRQLENDNGLAQEIVALGRRALPLQMDMTELQQIRDAVDATARHFGKLDILVNNAGIIRRADAVDFTEEDWDAVIDTNLKSL
ncbi:MAG TPA: SDR family NAD(P)-dependent oxidoreductase, partial [Acidobacteriaceae bacterium]|nr:SDR family NAD(P)-dependent oxidoreductase [Acidobacteriaceae bacterium]